MPSYDGRYAQFRIELKRSTDKFRTPLLRNVTLRWNGETRMIDVSGTIKKDIDGGVGKIYVNDAPLAFGLIMDIELYKNIGGYGNMEKRLSSSVTTEFAPRNTITK